MAKLIFSSLNIVCTIYVLSILKGTKDTIIITELGAELISAVKLYGVLPAAVIFTLFYTKLSNLLTQIQIYHLLNGCFISYFLGFCFFLYPNTSLIHFDFSEVILRYPYFKYQLLMFANWSYSLFYILSEMWGSVMLPLMFWQIANRIYSVEEAKKYYPLLALVGEVGAVLSGVTLSILTRHKTSVSWEISLKYICITIFIAGLIISLSVHFLKKYISSEQTMRPINSAKPGLLESFKAILSSRYIMLITVIIMCYGVSINLVEGVWKKHLGLLYPHSLDYCHFIAKVQVAMSCSSIFFILCSSIVLRKLRWQVGALVTPITMLITGSLFFILIVFKGSISQGWGDHNILFLCVIIGAIQNIVVKASKYSFFEPTKEMLYIPLDDELKSKGKSVADVLGEKGGKALGAFIQWSMLSFIAGATLVSISPYIFFIFLIVVIIWISAVLLLSRMF
ncbi:nucleotide transport protein [endosymbiont of Acanthamoeba sp. UWC8]|uniref:Npt1/Npt2 family nucleotide transporter n=1 Tax=endosymbiont of Acanthamoeba sp. UWC8 TaxID=86106 RepID=UPI0004D16C33|nr:Npt1/Npt2 family nucleotide transporter [endosymbiont of Acanthamoeba sp. UWC8]AIF81844.1 nucleotide transport protein [endosymbiont of Acanthamoeba sp. UWC8]